MAQLRAPRTLLLCGLLWAAQPTLSSWAAPAPPATEYQVKAVFVYNFSHFVEWPPGSFPGPGAPFVIGVLGGDEFAAQLDQAIRGEHVDQHPLQVRRFRNAEEIADCHILFIDRAEAKQLERVLARLQGRGTLTVSDLEGASRRGVMIQFATRENRVRLLINVDSAKAAGLTISSNLLRPSEIVRTDGTG